MSNEMNGRFWANGNTVFREPRARKTETGQNISMGFPVCTVTPAFNDAEKLALILNQALDAGIIKDDDK